MIRQRSARWLLALGLTLALSGGAYAIQKGTVLYIRSKNTRVMSGSAPTARALTVLQPGAQVEYVRQDEADKRWHWVKSGKVTGAVYAANLSERPPKQEALGAAAESTTRDMKAYAGTGAAVKALTPGALEYGKKSVKDTDVLRGLIGMETVGETTADKDVAKHARAAGLPSAAGLADRGTP